MRGRPSNYVSLQTTSSSQLANDAAHLLLVPTVTRLSFPVCCMRSTRIAASTLHALRKERKSTTPSPAPNNLPRDSQLLHTRSRCSTHRVSTSLSLLRAAHHHPLPSTTVDLQNLPPKFQNYCSTSPLIPYLYTVFILVYVNSEAIVQLQQ